MKTILIAAAAAALIAVPATAKLYSFSYIATGGTLQGRFDGTLQADGNTITVNSIADFVTFNGAGGTSLPFLNGGFYGAGVQGTPTVSLDGSIMSLTACDTNKCLQGILFSAPTSFFGPAAFLSSGVLGSAFELYHANKWSISAVPEAASWTLLIAGFGLVGGALRRRATVAA